MSFLVEMLKADCIADLYTSSTLVSKRRNRPLSDIEARLTGACFGAGLLNDDDDEWGWGQLKTD
jgi:hypothetical protein